MNWILLVLAGLFEVGFTTCLGKMKETTGNQQYVWVGLFVVFLSLSMWFLGRAIQTIPIGTAYAVWTGIGAVGTVLVGIFFFKEPANFMRIFFIVTLIGSIIGLKVASN